MSESVWIWICLLSSRLLDTVNWGEALTKSMIEKAELIRYSMECKFTLNAKLKQQVIMVVREDVLNLFQHFI